LDPPVVPPSLRSSVLQAILDDVNNNGLHLTTGIIGTKNILPVLSDANRQDVALGIASQTTYPSWGYMITNPTEPATTLWELWHAPMAGPEMNSRNHIMYGSVGAWLHRYPGGINPNGLSSIKIQPRMQFNSDLTYVTDTYSSLIGDITVTWQYGDRSELVSTLTSQTKQAPSHPSSVSGGRAHDVQNYKIFMLDVILPSNANAVVHLPTESEFGRLWTSVEESSNLLCFRKTRFQSINEMCSNSNTVLGINRITMDENDNHVSIHIGSGSFTFVLS